MSTPPGRIGKYELHEHLGRGGMAEVWKALDTELGRFVAIKIPHPDLQSDPQFVTRFEREARVIAALHHPNIIQIYDFHIARPPETETTLAYMVMDYVDGSTLAQYLHHTAHLGFFLSPIQLLQLFTPICLAVDYAHQQGMIHRDLKPSSILLDQRGLAKTEVGIPILSDFGIVKLLSSATNTLTGGVLGTPVYISPEQVAGTSGNERSDIYSLSVILYEACTGMLPFQGETAMAVMMQHMHTTPTPPGLLNKTLPPVLSAVIMQGLAKSPADRFATASALIAAVAEALGLPSPGSGSRPLMESAQDGLTSSAPSPALPSSHLQPELLPHVPPLGVSTREIEGGQVPAPMSTSGSAQLMTPPTGPTTPLPLLEGISWASYPAGAFNTGPRPPTLAAAPQTPPVSEARRNKPTQWRMLATFLTIALLLAGSLLSLLVLIPKFLPPKGSVVAQNPLVGSASFLSSGQLDPASSQGLNDTITMSLHNLSPPARGQSYYAWLMPDPTDETTVPLLLGRLSMTGGTAQFTYTHPDHANLLASYSGVEVAEQPSSQMPTIPPLDPKLWRYVGSIPNTPTPGDKQYYSLLSHMRHLLAKDPTLQQLGLQGGLDIWLYRNSEKILEWSSAARDSWAGGQQTGLIHRHMIRVLDYLDGAAYVYTSGDIPSGSPLLVDPQAGRIGLLEVSQTQVLPAYLTHVALHLQGLIKAPGHSQAQRQLAIKIDNALKTDTSLFQKVRQDAVKLVKMSDTQLKSNDALTLLNDMVTTANAAYTGQFDPTIGGHINGIVWIHNALQGIATMPVMAASTNKP